jgi:hypothetical protein
MTVYMDDRVEVVEYQANRAMDQSILLAHHGFDYPSEKKVEYRDLRTLGLIQQKHSYSFPM